MAEIPKLIVTALVALVVGWALGGITRVPQEPSPSPSPTAAAPAVATPTPTPVPESPPSEKNVVQITDTGFVHAGTGFAPHRLTVKAGETVTFVSKATAPVWPAGNPHPTHDAYPSEAYARPGDQAKAFGSKACVEYGIRKGDVFDACRLLLPEQTFSFTFTEPGKWEFHNHVRPEHTGTITVERGR